MKRMARHQHDPRVANVDAEVDLETKAQMLAACGSFTAGKSSARRWSDDPSLMKLLRSL
jgi:hypothetical protein